MQKQHINVKLLLFNAHLNVIHFHLDYKTATYFLVQMHLLCIKIKDKKHI